MCISKPRSVIEAATLQGVKMRLLPFTLAFLLLIAGGALLSTTVTGIEYYFDADPGPGLGTQVYNRDTVSLDQQVDTSTLSPGFHVLFVRAKNAEGEWGMPLRKSFFIPLPTSYNPQPVGTINRIEYFFDTDPGQGLGIPIYNRNTVSLDELISTAALSPGFHSIYVRSKDSDGQWGLTQRRSFFVPLPLQAPEPDPAVTQLEYFVDTDPGTGQGTVFTVTPGTLVSLDLALSFPGLQHGNHLLWFRARNSAGFWSLPVSRTFSDGVPADLSASYADGMVTLTWTDVYSVDTYKVYSKANMPDSFTEDLTGSFGTSSWTAPVTTPKRFYYVTSVYEEP